MLLEDHFAILVGDSFVVAKSSKGNKPLIKGTIFPLTLEERMKSAYGAIRSVFKRLRSQGYSTIGLKVKLCCSTAKGK